MSHIINSGRFYFWPIIVTNAMAMAVAAHGNHVHAAIIGVSISFLASYGFLLNDLWDRDVDRVNNARHFEDATFPAVVGGCVAATLFLTGGLAIGYSLGAQELMFAVLIATSLLAYTVVLRRILFVPNIMSALLAGSPLVAPLFLSDATPQVSHWLFVSAFMSLIFAREIMMDVRDRAGDLAGHRRTFPTVLGPKRAKGIAVLVLMSGACLIGAVVLERISSLKTIYQLGSLTIGATIIALVLVPAFRSIPNELEDRQAIQRFVLLSRFAMCLVPVLALLLW